MILSNLASFILKSLTDAVPEVDLAQASPFQNQSSQIICSLLILHCSLHPCGKAFNPSAYTVADQQIVNVSSVDNDNANSGDQE